MAYTRAWIQTRFGSGKRLEEICPEGALVSVVHGREARAEARHIVGNGGGQHRRRNGLLDDDVPVRIPHLPAEVSFFGVYGGCRGRFGLLRKTRGRQEQGGHR